MTMLPRACGRERCPGGLGPSRREEGASTVVLYEAQLEGLYEPQLRLRAGISSGASAEYSDRELDAIQLEAEPGIAFNCSSVTQEPGDICQRATEFCCLTVAWRSTACRRAR